MKLEVLQQLCVTQVAINLKPVKHLVSWLAQIISWLQLVRLRKRHVHLVTASQTLAQHPVTLSKLLRI